MNAEEFQNWVDKNHPDDHYEIFHRLSTMRNRRCVNLPQDEYRRELARCRDDVREEWYSTTIAEEKPKNREDYLLGCLNTKEQVVWVCTNHNADADNPQGHWYLGFSNFPLKISELEEIREVLSEHWNEVRH